LPLLSAAVVSGEALTAMTFGLCAWGAVRLVSGWCSSGGPGLTLAQTRAEADHACARGRFGTAKTLYERAILIAEQRQCTDEAVVRDYYNLAATTAMLGDFSSAGRQLVGLARRLRLVDAHWAEHAAWLTRYVAGQLVARGESARAVRLAELSEALLGSAEAAGALEPGERAAGHKELGWVLLFAGELTRAERAFRRSVEDAAADRCASRSEGAGVPAEPSGKAPPWTPYRGAAASTRPRARFEPDAARLGLAECSLVLGRLVEARLLFEEMRAELCSDLCGPEFAGRVLRGLGRTEAGLGNRRAALALLEAAYDYDVQGDRTLGAAALDLTLLADLHARRGATAEASRLLSRARSELSARPPRGVCIEIEAVTAELALEVDPREAQLRIDAALDAAACWWGDAHPRMVPLLGLAAAVAIANDCLGLAERRLGRARMLAAALDATHPLHRQLARVSRSLQRARAAAPPRATSTEVGAQRSAAVAE